MALLALLKKLTLTQWVLGLLVTALLFQTARVAAERKKVEDALALARTATLSLSNEKALSDSTHKLTSDSLKALGDSVVLYQRQAVQAAQKASQLDRELGQLTVANYGLTVRLDSVHAISEVPVVRRNDTLSAEFHVEQTPYHVDAKVRLPQTGMGNLTLGIRQDPMGLGVKVGCGALSTLGVREATVNVLAPKYAVVKLDSLTQSPEVCSPAPAATVSVPLWKKVGYVLFGALLMRVIH